MHREGRGDAAGEVSDPEEVQFAPPPPFFLHQIKWRKTDTQLLDGSHISRVAHKQHFLVGSHD